MEISVIGTGYVGLVTGVSLAQIGHTVTCVDNNEEKITKLKQFKSPIYEPGIEELIEENVEQNRLTFKLGQEVDYSQFDAIYLAVGTPQSEDGTADLTFINQVVIDIKNKCHQDMVIVTKSTVPVGTNASIEQKLNEDSDYKFTVVSNPEFLREGSAIEDVFHPERIILGSDDEAALDMVEEINEPFHAPVVRSNFESAEIIKYASNAFLATKISYINMIADLCEAVGADVQTVSRGMGLDSRIGNKFLKAGIGYGGSCFPKDTSALTKIAEQHDVDSSIIKSAIKVNQDEQVKLVSYLDDIYPALAGKKISLLGLAFKPETDDIRDAASIRIINELLDRKAKIHVYDPEATNNIRNIFGGKLTYSENISDCLQDSEAALVITEWKEIKGIQLQTFKDKMRRALILDGRGALLNATDDPEIEYQTIGRRGIN
ncbi:UDP-glucose 6-dehydrogenase [Companilactobacillus sp. RD055328]|uniref:UDP-glucose dehydrogenase family protein n=1 Tax=Companilactobacillus sp. RD055328 TaxID=2916634 RepID=UPI001FC83127|nr:UDP-glucose/GDP-mannose dehydrogenase family protein [Companilactobacillus sp. RD055328]GKQ43365.1 UDP-glucose 6-dehydrogenase [Companilactobacillus sp. RD055328]